MTEVDVEFDQQPSVCDAALKEAKRRAGLLHTDAPSRRAAAADLERRMVQQSEQLQHLKALFRNPDALQHRRGGNLASSSHVDPTTAIRTACVPVSKSRRAVNDVTEGERVEITCELVKGLRQEVAAWTRELLVQFPAGTFADFFSSPITNSMLDDAHAPLPPPPSQDSMLTAYHARQDCEATEAMAEASRNGVQQAVNSLQCEARHKLTSCVADFVRGVGPAAHAAPAYDPVEVAGIVPASMSVQRVQQSVRETHALVLLSHVMHAAAAVSADQRGSRGSSETPSVTTIGSIMDNHSGVGGPSASHLAAVGAFAHTAATADGSGAAGVARATSATAPEVGGTSMRAGGMVSAASSVFSPIPAQQKSVGQRAAGNRSIRFQEATATRVRGESNDGSQPEGGSTAEGGAMVTSVGDSSSGSREQPSSSGTQHDTSTAATGGMSTGGSTDRAPQTKNVWSAADQRESSSSDHARGSSHGSTSSSSRKKKRGLFSCIRRDDSGDDS